MHRKKSVFGIQAAATIIGMIVLGTLLLFWAYLLPTGRMKSHIAESDETFNYEGIYPMIIHGYKCTQLDNYTDGLMYTTAIYPGSGDTLRDMLENPRIEYDDANMVQGMNDYANDVKERESHQYEITYGRYCAGTARDSGSPGDPGTDGRQGAVAVRRSSAGGVSGVRRRRCAAHGF